MERDGCELREEREDAKRDVSTRQDAASTVLQEFVDCGGMALRVDAAAGVVRGVKLLGLESRNGRSYLPAALEAAVPLYEGAKVNVNHPRGGPLSPRDYQDRIGQVRGVTLRPGEGLFGDFHFNPRHALAEQLAWDAQHAPANVGFSHNVEARTVRRGDRTLVEAILRVNSVDLVADPATTRGLFEDESSRQAAPPAEQLSQQIAEQATELAALRGEVARLAALVDQKLVDQKLVEQTSRQPAAGNTRPQSREQGLAEGIFGPINGRDFARLIR